MNLLRNLPVGGFVVIVVIGLLFVLALLILFYTSARYRALGAASDGDGEGKRGFLKALLAEFSASYQKYGRDVNTPAIISDVIGKKLGGLLLCERFLNNAVSLFVTLGLFGTFLGLSMSVSSLTELISYTNTEEWLSVLDSVGGGLMSALGGMGVAFYTSLVGAGCSILLTILRTILSPQAEREKLETGMELWLDTEVAPGLATESATDDAGLVKRMIAALTGASDQMQDTMRSATDALTRTAAQNRSAMEQFDQTVGRFNAGVHDFTEVDYNLRGSVERMDLAVRDLANALREVNRRMDGDRR
jgi:hypothetical protein